MDEHYLVDVLEEIANEVENPRIASKAFRALTNYRNSQRKIFLVQSTEAEAAFTDHAAAVLFAEQVKEYLGERDPVEVVELVVDERVGHVLRDCWHVRVDREKGKVGRVLLDSMFAPPDLTELDRGGQPMVTSFISAAHARQLAEKILKGAL